jgi:hypothetical protein
MRRFLILAALLFAAPAAAQQRGFTVDEIVDLLRNEVGSERVLFLAQQRCIHFVPDKEAVARVAAGGGSEELVAGLRAPTLCSTLPRARQPQPVPQPVPTPEAPPVVVDDAPRAERRGKPLFVLGLGFASSGFSPEEGASIRGQGAAVDLAVEGRHFGAFAHGEFADVDPSTGDPFVLGHSDFGVRLLLLAPGSAVRPYLDVAGTVLSMEYNDPDTGTTSESVTGYGATGAAGLRIGLSTRLALDGSVRVTRGTLREVESDGSGSLLRDPRSGASTRAVVGVSWTPGAR